MTFLPSLFGREHKHDPARRIEEMMNRMFHSWPLSIEDEYAATFPLDVKEEADHYTVKANLPGVRKEDITVTLENNLLTITSKETREEEKKEATWLMRERSYAAASRSVHLPLASEDEPVDATLREGILTLVIPKSKEKAAKKVEIH